FRIRCPLIPVNADEALFINLHFGVFETQASAVWTSPNRHKDAIERLLRFNAFAFESGDDPFGGGFEFGNFRTQVNRLELMIESLLQWSDEISIGSGQQPA